MIQNEGSRHFPTTKTTINSADVNSNSTDSHSADGRTTPTPSRTASISKKPLFKQSKTKENIARNQKSNSKQIKTSGEVLELRRLKQAADASFDKQDFHSAIQGYRQILEMLEITQASSHLDGLDSCLNVKLLANISQCLLKLNRYEESLDYSLQIIKMDNEYFKAHYRAGVALKFLKRDDEALEVLKQGLSAVKASRDDYSRKMYLDLFHELEKTCDKSIEEMKEQIKDFCEPNKKNVPSRFNKSLLLDRTTVLLSLTTATITGAVCLARRQLFSTYGILLTAGNTFGSMVICGAKSSMMRAFGLGGLFLFNYLLFIMLK